MITIYTDGACKGNPGPGGWAALMTYLGKNGQHAHRTLTGRSIRTTNNRMELRAIVCALEAIRKTGNPVTIYTDSRYVVDGVTSWLPNWKRNGWRTKDRKPVLNQDLWQQLDAAIERQQADVTFVWVRGHTTVTSNLLANTAAQAAADEATDEDKEDIP